MGSSEPRASESRRPGRDVALRQLLRPLEPYLARPEVTELAVNRPGELWMRSPSGWTRQELPELSAEYLDALATGMAVGMTPITIRKHLAAVRTLAELEQEGTFAAVRDVSFHRPSPEEVTCAAERCDESRLEPTEVELLTLKRDRRWGAFLRRAVQTRRNIVIAGKTGSGKTTLARSLIDEVSASERIVTIEDVHELALPNHPNRVHLMRGGEAWEYVQSLNTGHPGSVTTTHANGAVQAFERIVSLIKNSEVGRGLDLIEIRRALHAALDVVLFMAERRVTEVYFDPMFSRERTR